MRVSTVRKQERDTLTQKIANPHMMDMLLKIDWMMADIVHTCYYSQFSIGRNWAVRRS